MHLLWPTYNWAHVEYHLWINITHSNLQMHFTLFWYFIIGVLHWLKNTVFMEFSYLRTLPVCTRNTEITPIKIVSNIRLYCSFLLSKVYLGRRHTQATADHKPSCPSSMIGHGQDASSSFRAVEHVQRCPPLTCTCNYIDKKRYYSGIRFRFILPCFSGTLL